MVISTDTVITWFLQILLYVSVYRNTFDRRKIGRVGSCMIILWREESGKRKIRDLFCRELLNRVRELKKRHFFFFLPMKKTTKKLRRARPQQWRTRSNPIVVSVGVCWELATRKTRAEMTRDPRHGCTHGWMCRCSNCCWVPIGSTGIPVL